MNEKRSARKLGSLAVAALLAVGCGDASRDASAGSADSAGAGSGSPDSGGDSDDSGPLPGPAVGQGGAQDFGQFRAILEAGGVPGPSTLDDVGFFNEHRIPLGEATCDDAVCLHGELGVMGNMLDGSNCTMVMMGMTTPIDIDSLERPALNLAIAIDTSGSMGGASIEYVREGLSRMAESLQPDDQITLVTFSDQATLWAEAVSPDAPELWAAIDAITAQGQTNIYAGLRTAFEAVERHVDPLRQNRVILLSDGEANTGVVSDPRMLQLAEAYGHAGFGLSTIGMGGSFDPELMRGLSERGAGAFYFLEDLAAVREVFEEEVAAFVVPLAQEVTIDVDVSGDYELRDIYGTKLADISETSGRISIPILQIAHRTSDADNEQGRRGGGGAIVAELVPVGDGAGLGEIGNLTMRYRVPHTEQWVDQAVEIETPLSPGETPDAGHFSAEGAQKAFVTLNLYVGFAMAAYEASVGDDRGALAVLLPLRDAVSAWELENPDDDIADDLRYVDMFIENLLARGAEDPPPQQNPPNPWPQD